LENIHFFIKTRRPDPIQVGWKIHPSWIENPSKLDKSWIEFHPTLIKIFINSARLERPKSA
jgi:hypothetical protein